MSRVQPHHYLLLLAVAAGSQTVLGKFALERMPVFGYATLRFILAYVFIYAAMRMTGRSIPWKKIIPFAPVGLITIAAGTAFIFGLQRTNATTAQFIHTAIPILTALFAGMILRRRLSNIQWIGVMIAFFGVVVTITSNGGLSLQNTSFIGNLLVFLSALGFAFYAVLTKLPRYKDVDPFEMIFISFTFGVPLILPFAVAEYIHIGNWVPAVSAEAWIAVLLASVSMVFFATVFQMLINKVGPSYASLNQYLNPIVVIFWAALLLQELPVLQAVIGALIALMGVGLVTWRQRKDDLEASVRASNSAE